MSWTSLKSAIKSVIKTNNNQEITGEILQNTLITIVNSVGANATFAGVAIPSTNPGTPDGLVFYLASQAGRYSNFGNVEIEQGKLYVFTWDGTVWSHAEILDVDNIITSTNGLVYDVSVKHPASGVDSGNTYTLSGALAVIPATDRKAGMSIKFIDSEKNEYVQYRFLGATSDGFTNVANWQGVDSEPTAGSNNLVQSGGVWNKVDGSDKSIYDKIHSTLFGGDVSADPMNFPVVNAVVSTVNNYRLQGKSSLVDVAGATGISVTSETSGHITFITEIPTLNPSNNQSVSFAQGESGRRIYDAGTTSFDVPENAKYALILRENSQGVNVSPSAIQINRSDEITIFKSFSASDFDSIKETGIYKSGSSILLVTNYTSSPSAVVQVHIAPYKNLDVVKARIRFRLYTYADNIWGDWIDYEEWVLDSTHRGFSSAFNYANIDSLITNGIYRVNSYTANYGFPIVLVRNTNNIISQVIFNISSSGKFFINTRQSTDNGSTWSDWEDYLKDINNHLDHIDNDLQLLNSNYEVTEVDISGLTIVDASIVPEGLWKHYAPNVAGKSFIIDCTDFERIIITTTFVSHISFLKSLPPSFDSTIPADFADGESGRRSVAVGDNVFVIPLGAKYIAYQCKASSDADMSPSKIEIANSNTLLRANNFSKQVVGVHGQVIDDVIHLENMSNIVPVSDPLSAFASGESNVYHEPETGLVYFTCIEGFDHPYEAYDCVSLYVFSLTNPNRVKRFQIAKASDKGVLRCYTPNLVYISYKKIRVFYTFQNENGTDGAYLYYKDFNFATETFSAESKVKTTDLNDLTAAAIRQFTINEGGIDTGRAYVYIQKITDIAEDGYRYCTLNCGESTNYNIVIARSNNNFETIELVTITPFRLRYDCAIGVLDAKLYFVYRVAGDEYASTSGTSLCTAEISNGGLVNWSTPIKFAEGDSRPDCYTYKDKVYMMAGNYHSVAGKPMRVSSSVWEGTSDDPSDYTKVLVVSDTRGVQNPRVFRYGYGDYGVLMQNSPARVDYPQREATGKLQWQFKTAVCFVCSRIN